MVEDTKKPLEQKFGDHVQEANQSIFNSNFTMSGYELIRQGFSVFLLAQGSNAPNQGSRGHLDATNDPGELEAQFNAYGVNCNIGIALRETKLIVLDIDRHTPDKNGLKSLRVAGVTTDFDNEVFELTPRGGLHLFYRVPDGLDVSSFKRAVLPGVELINDKITVAPSVRNGVAYQHFGPGYQQANMMPQWLVNLANSASSVNGQQINRASYSVPQRWGMVVDGFNSGERNMQATSLSGYLLWLGIEPNKAFDIIKTINLRSESPLETNELITIFKSCYEREKKRRLNAKF